ncbi:GGDEF domain-containing protein [Clostridium chromiireducens]|uniref:GGDEF domain-containing protein n=1 Tax=Clostridium chromiireducens TaxID=225345 RepID=A0A399IRN9_9CLOT|nr:GGDEF domain-containing protein [Clostridium chromiireducens]RII35718.1 GGDEF domain-containing protein [Clostridium chromiireducens]
MEIINQVKERLSIFKNLYDVIRIVDPLKKQTTILKDNEIQQLKGTCYALWRKDTFCENCISMRAYLNNDTFVKLEYDQEKIVLITATPVEIEGKIYIMEILKDITKNGSALHKLTENSYCVEEMISSINEKVVKDELTGLYNRRYINERLPADVKNSKVSNIPLSVIMADIDFFKNINDKYGHVIGDKILTDFSNLILNSIRNNSDWVGRFGGEEFIIVLNGTESKNAYLVAEKIRKLIEDKVFTYEDIEINITASFGVYSVKDNNISISDVLLNVDRNLYKAKASGRNRTIIDEGTCEERLEGIKQKSIKLVELNRHINEIRELLNEACCMTATEETINDRLLISQYLDELIVQYMKDLNNLN